VLLFWCVKEAEIQRAILDYLTLKRYFHWRNNTGAFKAEHGGFYRFGTPGSPDIFVLHDGTLYGIEVKAPQKKQSEAQLHFQVQMTLQGGVYVVAHSIDDVQAIGL
jgi:hypothetical protein